MKTALIFTTALCVATSSAYAGGSHDEHQPPAQQPAGYTATANNTALAGAAALSRSASSAQSHSAANATGGNAVAQGGHGGAGGAGGRGGNASTGAVTVNNSAASGGGGYQYQARNNTPDVLAPSITGGNPCTVGASGGLAVPAFGLSFGASSEGANCVLRANATLLYNMGMVSAAKAMLCQDTHYANAFALAGQPCEADVRRWQQAGYRPVGGGFWSK